MITGVVAVLVGVVLGCVTGCVFGGVVVLCGGLLVVGGGLLEVGGGVDDVLVGGGFDQLSPVRAPRATRPRLGEPRACTSRGWIALAAFRLRPSMSSVQPMCVAGYSVDVPATL